MSRSNYPVGDLLEDRQWPLLSQRIDPVNYYTPDNLHLAELNIRTWCTSPFITPFLLRLVAKMRATSGIFPTLEELVRYFLQRACICILNFDPPEQEEITRYFLSTHGRLSTCVETVASMQVRAVQGRFPSPEELITAINILEEIAFAFQAIPTGPTANLDRLASSIMKESDKNCALCCDSLEPGCQVYILTPCGHAFHSKAEHCLGTSTIISWLEKHRTCPVCRSEVTLTSS